MRSGQTAGGSLDTGELSLDSTRGPGGPFNVAQLYMRMAEGIREGRSVSPDFDVAVKRDQLLEVIQKGSDTGMRQILERRSSARLTTCSPAVSRPW